jgi:coatomer subunit beta
VRKNSVLAIFTIYKSNPSLIPDATDLIQNYIKNENDPSAKRNALLMLMHTSLPLAVAFYHTVVQNIPAMDLGQQLVFIEMIRKDCRNPSADKVFLVHPSHF